MSDLLRDLEFEKHKPFTIPEDLTFPECKGNAEKFDNDSSEGRKEIPLFRGLAQYFPDALRRVANCSYVANEKHNPNEEMYWNREKSTDEADCLMRHLFDSMKEDVDDDGILHLTKVAWRSLALLQKFIETNNLKK